MSKQKNDYEVLKPAIKTMYMQGSSAPEITLIFKDVPVSTVYSWITKEGWKSEKEAADKNIANAPQVLMSAFVELLNKIRNEGTADDLAANADAVSKIAKAYKTLFKEADILNTALWFFKEYASYLRDNKSQLILDQEFYDKQDIVLQGFQKYLIIKYSPKNVG